MPCSSGPDERSLNAEFSARQQRKYETALNGLTAMLCSACTALEQKEFDFSINPKLDDWWAKHKERDLKRLEKEAKERLSREEAMEIAKKPFMKLTDEDKKKLKKAGLL